MAAQASEIRKWLLYHPYYSARTDHQEALSAGDRVPDSMLVRGKLDTQLQQGEDDQDFQSEDTRLQATTTRPEGEFYLECR